MTVKLDKMRVNEMRVNEVRGKSTEVALDSLLVRKMSLLFYEMEHQPNQTRYSNTSNTIQRPRAEYSFEIGSNSEVTA